jgi:transcriptional regulator with XRE-family HTH domain
MHERFCVRLQREFARRKRTNASYSIRAFSQFLGVNHSTLSKMLNATRSIPARQIRAWGRKLDILDEEVEVYVACESVPDAVEIKRGNKILQWSAEAAALMSSDSHWAIVELTRDRSFRADSRWIAARLGMSSDEVNVAFTRLLRLGLLTTDEEGRWMVDDVVEPCNRKAFVRVALTRLKHRADAA